MRKIISFMLSIMLLMQFPGTSIVAHAASSDEMTAIMSEFSEYMIGNTVAYSGDSYVSTGADVAVFFYSML